MLYHLWFWSVSSEACMAAAGCPRLVPALGRACNKPGAPRVLINVYGFMFNSWIKSPKYGI